MDVIHLLFESLSLIDAGSLFLRLFGFLILSESQLMSSIFYETLIHTTLIQITVKSGLMMITSNRIRVWDETCPDATNPTTTVFGLPEGRNCHQISFRSKPGRTCCWVGPGKTAVGSVEGSAEGLLGFEQFPVPKAYEADEVSGSVHIIIAPTILTNIWQQ